MTPTPSISDAFKTVVPKVQQAIIDNTELDWGGIPKRVYFMHGHPKEIVYVLQSYTQAANDLKNSKYPLIALLRDIKEEVSYDSMGPVISFNARLVICTLTSPNLRADEREVRNFKPILLPILEELVNQITQSQLFGCPSKESMQLVKWDRYFWGTQAADKNVLNDYIDAVEVERMRLRIYTNNCQ